VGVRRMASHRERRQRKLIDKFLTFRKNQSNDLLSRKMVLSAMVASFRQSDGHENAGRLQIAHPHYDLNPYDFMSPEAPKRKGWPRGRRNPLKRLDSREERAWVLLPLAWIFLPQRLGFFFLRLGFSFLKAWIFLPQDLAN